MTDEPNEIPVEHAPEVSRELVESAFMLKAVGAEPKLIEDEAGAHLVVDAKKRDFALEQLAHYRRERVGWPPPALELLRLKFTLWPALVVATFLLAFYRLQHTVSVEDLARRASSGAEIFTRGEWWRPVTALFLHADEAHVLGNLLFGSLLAVWLVPLLGHGLTWTGFLFSGALGNLVNAFLYRAEPRHSIGFSTAVFGAMGVWAGFQLLTRALPQSGLALWRRLLGPFGAALFFLAAWGASPKSDYMAHLWGLVGGFLFGVVVGFGRLDRRFAGRWTQGALVLLSLFVVVGAWVGARA